MNCPSVDRNSLLNRSKRSGSSQIKHLLLDRLSSVRYVQEIRKNGGRVERRTSDNYFTATTGPLVSNLYNVLCSRSFLAVYNFKADALTFGKRFESVCFNSGMMDKHILASILFDKAKALCIIKPLYCSFCHCCYSCVMGSIWPLFSIV